MKNFFSRFGKSGKQESDKQEPDFKDEVEILDYILNGGLAKMLVFQSELRNDSLYLPEIQMSIRPFVRKLEEKYVNLGFDIYSEKWEGRMYESCAGTGDDTRTAVGQALASFAFTFMAGLGRLTDKYKPRKISSEFAGHTHNWDVYLGDLIQTGVKKEKNNDQKVAVYWELLGEDIIKRLGNQKIVYVKIYAAKVPGKMITGECRINDVPVMELGEKVIAVAEKWKVKGFASEKQFFFIEQTPETVLFNPYDGRAGREKMKSYVTEYLRLFQAVQSPEEYDRLVDNATERLGDRVLAIECFSFLIEICGERFFSDKMRIGDYIEIGMPDGTLIPAYKSQISDYHMLSELVFEIFDEGVFGEDTQEIYLGLVSCSAIYNTVQQAAEQNADIKNLRMTKMIFNVDEGFELR